MKKKFPTVLVICVILPAAVGCGPRRSPTVNPPLDPIFSPAPGTPGQAHRQGQGDSRYTLIRTRPAPYGPWVVANRSNRWNYIIVHHSATQAGGARRFDQSHRGNGWDEMGYHFVIGNGSDTTDGRIEVGSRWQRQKHGAHCRVPGDATNKYNEHGIGICLVGDFNHSPPSRAQMQSLIYLTKGLLNYTNLSPSAVHFHKDFKSTDCPGRYFPYPAYKKALRK